jgi:hypothetical protein
MVVGGSKVGNRKRMGTRLVRKVQKPQQEGDNPVGCLKLGDIDGYQAWHHFREE